MIIFKDECVHNVFIYDLLGFSYEPNWPSDALAGYQISINPMAGLRWFKIYVLVKKLAKKVL